MSRILDIYCIYFTLLVLSSLPPVLLVDPEHSMTTKLYSGGYHRNCSLLSHPAKIYAMLNNKCILKCLRLLCAALFFMLVCMSQMYFFNQRGWEDGVGGQSGADMSYIYSSTVGAYGCHVCCYKAAAMPLRCHCTL